MDEDDTDGYTPTAEDEQYRQESIMQALVDQAEHELRPPFEPVETVSPTAAEMAEAEAWLLADPAAAPAIDEMEARRIARNARAQVADHAANSCPICHVRPSAGPQSLCTQCRNGRLGPAFAALDAEVAAGLNPLDAWA